ncbi:MAG TPA: deoxyribose-phosphate aldolase [Gemmatimonadaceae bacterium]
MDHVTPAVTIARCIDHTLLRPEATAADIDRLCDEAQAYGFAAVCVAPMWVAQCATRLGGAVPVAAVIAFPLGATPPEVKVAEAACAVADGATELDMVAAIGRIRGGDWDCVRRDIRAVVEAASGAMVKVILETAVLSREEIVRACGEAVAAGAHAVKTSTGVHPAGGASPEAVALLRSTVGPRIGVKASGGIRDCDTALRMLASGASRIGTSSGVAIADCLGDEPIGEDPLALARRHRAECRTRRLAAEDEARGRSPLALPRP